MSMRQAPFLVLNDIRPSKNFTEDLIFCQVMEQGSKLQPEYTSHQVRPVTCVLARIQLILNLTPLRVRRHGDEERGVATRPYDRHAITIRLGHVFGAANMA